MARRKKHQGPRFHKYAELLNDVHYTDVDLLRTFISNYKKILPARRFALTTQQQRNLQRSVKRARYMALLPYTNGHK